MSRPQRIEFEDAYYHVMNRGARRCDIFDDDIDRRSFLDILGEASQRHGVRSISRPHFTMVYQINFSN